MPTGTAAAGELTIPARDHFKVLAEWWHESTDYLSSPREKAAHPAYRLIVQMGAVRFRSFSKTCRNTVGATGTSRCVRLPGDLLSKPVRC